MTNDQGAPSAWSRVADLFYRALELPETERAAFVDAQAAHDQRLAAEVHALLEAHQRPDARVDHPPLAIDRSSAESPPQLAGPATDGTDSPGEIGPYRLRGVIGAGGMGIVYLAEDTRLNRVVALKALPRETSADPGRAARLAREARLAASLSHPDIATVYAFETFGEQVVIATEYVGGPTLRQALQDGPLPPARVSAVLQRVAAAVAAAHARGIVHRDLKPENIICTDDGGIKVLDFGIAHVLDEGRAPGTLTREAALFGTPGYMAPEQIRGEPVDGRADVFALGVIGYEMLAGRAPFDADHPAAMLARVLEMLPAPISPTPPPALARLVFACLEKDPAARLPSAAALLEALRTADTDRVAPAAPIGPRAAQNRARWWWRVHQTLAILIHVLLLLPLWRARDLTLSDRGMWLFLAGVLAVTVGGALRMHLLFSARERPDTMADEQRRHGGLVHAADVAYALTLLVAGIVAIRAEAPAVLLVAAAASVAVASLVIDRATTAAAWGDGERQASHRG